MSTQAAIHTPHVHPSCHTHGTRRSWESLGGAAASSRAAIREQLSSVRWGALHMDSRSRGRGPLGAGVGGAKVGEQGHALPCQLGAAENPVLISLLSAMTQNI